MMIKTETARTLPVLIAGALALTLMQGARAEEGRTGKDAPAVVKVSAPSEQMAIHEPTVATEIEAQIEALNERIARDLEKSLEQIGFSRIELVIAEVPPRG